MHLVDRDRRARRLQRGAGAASRRRRSSSCCSGAVTIEPVAGGALGRPGDRVGLLRQTSRRSGRSCRICRSRPACTPGRKMSHTPAPMVLAHRVPGRVPVIEVADHRDPARVRRPDREARARQRRHTRPRARPAPGRDRDAGPRSSRYRSSVAERGAETVRVLRLVGGAVRLHAQAVAAGSRDRRLRRSRRRARSASVPTGSPARSMHLHAVGIRAGTRADGLSPSTGAARASRTGRRAGASTIAAMAPFMPASSSPSRRSAIAYMPPSGMPTQVGPVRRLVLDLVSRLLEQEQIEQRPARPPAGTQRGSACSSTPR